MATSMTLAEDQLRNLTTIPAELVQKWPIVVGYAVINWVSDMTVAALPFPTGGTGRQISQYLVEGVVDTTKALYGQLL